ncbi:MAG TPA: 1-deoxy-D-xylulose-5-phosphate reductoisomerase [Candidatus Limnocylindria bacterium]|nr:1-deoxy-D-xylulose-5-phosphate reductoisomerase [Candidatus Limnocylindria bacterium]
MVTRLAILGATGSIGRQALDVVVAHPDRLRVTALASRRNADDLGVLAAKFGARGIVTERDGTAALVAAATAPDVDLVLVATSGIDGIEPTLAALEAGKSVALANKETLVAAGHLVRRHVPGACDRLRPVDGEHCALLQCLSGTRPSEIERVLITASGGPFRTLPLDELARVTPETALKHPTWRMGPKITIDSATLANKGFEVVEARWLYDLTYDRIGVVVHPESIVHAMVELADGSIRAQMAEPDMRLFIQYALLWGHAPSPTRPMDWSTPRALHFAPVDADRYPCLATVLETARSGDLSAMVGLVAADEVAVERFLAKEIGFGEIAVYLHRGAALGRSHGRSAEPSLAEIRHIDAEVRGALRAEPVLR